MKYPALMKVLEAEVNEKVSNAEAAKEQETLVTSILNLMDSTKWTVEKAMESLKIPPAQQATYAGLVGKRLK